MRGAKRREVLTQIKAYRKAMRLTTRYIDTFISQWDIHFKCYSAEEYAARFLRLKKEFDVTINIDQETLGKPMLYILGVVFGRYGHLIIMQCRNSRQP